MSTTANQTAAAPDSPLLALSDIYDVPALLAENDRLASQVVQLRAALERVAILGADSYDAQANACHDEALAALAAAKGGAS